MLGFLGVLFFIFGLLGSIALHEIGHLVPAKKFGVRVSQYMVGFGPTLWSRTRGETEYGVKAIPMGGYIRMIGMYPPSNNPQRKRGPFAELIEDSREMSLEEIQPGEQHRTFYSLSIPKKLIVMFSGPFMNFIIACVLFTVSLSVIGYMAPTTTVAQTLPCVPTVTDQSGELLSDGTCGAGSVSPASSIGLKAGDTIVAVDNHKVTSWTQLGDVLADLGGHTVPITFSRNGEEISRSVTIGSAYDLQSTDGSPRGFIGLSPTRAPHRESISAVGPFMWADVRASTAALGHFPVAVYDLGRTLMTNGPRNPNGPVGVIGVGRITDQIASQDSVPLSNKIGSLLMMLAGLNLFLFLFNLVPILPLDGGHMAGAMFEGIRRFVARLRGISPLPGPTDTARLLPLTYVVAIVMIVSSLLVAVADIIKPVTLG